MIDKIITLSIIGLVLLTFFSGLLCPLYISAIPSTQSLVVDVPVVEEEIKMPEVVNIPDTFKTFRVTLELQTQNPESSKYFREKIDSLTNVVKTVPSIKEINVISFSGVVGDFSYELEKD